MREIGGHPGWHKPCSTRPSECRARPLAGSGHTITSARTWHSSVSPVQKRTLAA